MILTNITLYQTIYLIVVPIIIIGLILLLIVRPLYKSYYKKHFDFYYYKTIYDIALNNDYYLINNFYFKLDDDKTYAKINHILFADKYIYLITDVYFNGDVLGKVNDNSLICIKPSGKKQYVNNPILVSKFLLSRLSMKLNQNPTLMVGIVVYNDNVKLELASDSKQFYIVKRKKLKSLIKAIESRNIGKIKQKELEKLVQLVNEINKKGEK
jgi:hypothetical protein